MPEPLIALSATLLLASVSLPPGVQEDAKASVTVPEAVDSACAWLLAHQSDDGRWDSDGFMIPGGGAGRAADLDDDAFWERALGAGDTSTVPQRLADDGPGDPTADVGITGLALRALVADGRAAAGASGRDDLLRGIDWLVAQQDGETGLFGAADGFAFHYGHAIATLALAETMPHLGEADAGRDAAYAGSLTAAVAYIERARNPYGAWRYESPPNGDSDTSLTVWMVLALAAAEDAGVELSADAMQGARSWLQEMTDPETGRVGYVERGSPSSRVPGRNELHPTEGAEVLTAGALLARLRMGDKPRAEADLVAHVRLVLRGLHDTATDYVQDAIWIQWGTSALAEIDSLPWDDWSKVAAPLLMGTQDRDGGHVGSWDPKGAWGYSLGRVGTTALLAHALASVEAKGSEGAGADSAPAQDALSSSSLEEPIAHGLAWLAGHQEADGHWSADGFMAHDPEDERSDGAGMPVHDVGVTALALMAFMGDGQTPAKGEHRDAVARGLEWLVKRQEPEVGSFADRVGYAFMYDHALAALAVTEALNLTGSEALRVPAQEGLNFIARCRNPYGVWRYSVPPDGENDTSLTAWMMQVIRSGQDAGLKVDLGSWDAATIWIDEMTDLETGRVGYTERGSRSARVPGMNVDYPLDAYEALTAAGLYTRFLAGQGANGPSDVMKDHAELVAATTVSLGDPSTPVDLYAVYYSSRALYQMGGEPWSRWSAALRTVALETQRKDGAAGGSWDPDGPWGYAGGRVYSTAMMLLNAMMVR